MRGLGSHPLGWATTLLIAVAYAHVLLEIAAAVLAVAIGVRLLIGPGRSGLEMSARRRGLLDRPWCRVVIQRRPASERERDRVTS